MGVEFGAPDCRELGYLVATSGDNLRVLLASDTPGHASNAYASYIFACNNTGARGWFPSELVSRDGAFGL